MITLFRNFAKSKWAAGLLVLIALSLLVGVGSQRDVIGSLTPQHVIDAGDRSIDQARFRSDFDRVREQLEQQAQRPVSIEDMIKENIHLRYLDSQSKQLGFLNWAWNAGIRPGKALVIKEIRKIPAFFDSVTGQFSQEAYQAALAQRNMTPTMAEQEFRDQYVMQHYSAALGAGARLPRVYGALVANQALESRDARWFTISRAIAGSTPAPTDAQLTAFIQQNIARLRMPEFRVASVVLFNDGSAAKAPVSDADIQKRFDFRKDALSQPEKRTFVTLAAPTRAAADKIAAALRAGQTPAAAGATANVQPAAFNDAPRSAISDPAVAAAVFGLAANQVSDPVQGRIGFTVARVTSIVAGHPATLAEVRPQLIEELQSEAARARTFERVTQYQNARTAGKAMDEAARLSGGRVIQLPPVARDGRMRNGQQLNAPPQVLENVWKLGKAAESDVIDAGQGQYFAMRVDDIIPAAVPPLAEIRAPLAAEWTRQENARLMLNKATALEARIRGGEDIAAVARSVGATLTTRPGMQQNQSVQDAVGQGVLQGVFSSGRGEVFSGAGAGDTYVVGRVDRISAAVPALAAPLVDQVRSRMLQQSAQAIAERAIIAGAARSKARYDLAQARAALGLPPEEAAPATGSAPAAPAPAQ